MSNRPLHHLPALKPDNRFHSSSSVHDQNIKINVSNLPRTVRGAPPELRGAIRKRQNSESAKRCRERKKIQNEEAQILSDMQSKSLERLEMVVSMLSKRIDSTMNIVSSLTSTIHGSAVYFAPPPPLNPLPSTLHPPQPTQQQEHPLPTPIKRVVAMMDAGMQVAPAQIRAVQNAINSDSSISNSSNDANSLVPKADDRLQKVIDEWKFNNRAL